MLTGRHGRVRRRCLCIRLRLYIGIKTPRTFVQKGEKIEIESIVSDLDGKLIAGRDAEIKAVLKDWVFDKGAWTEKVIDEQNCPVKSGETPQKCSFIAKQGGRIHDHGDRHGRAGTV